MKVTVLTWNIHKGIGGVDRRYRPERVIELIRYYKPDVCLLQEVDEGVRRSNYHRQVDFIGDNVGLRHRVYSVTHKLRGGNGQYGNAILSRWPLFDEHNLDLTIGFRKKRGCIYARARVRFASGKTRTLGLYNLHLGLAGSERAKQLDRFISSHPFQGLHARTPVVLGGDFNDVWGTLGTRFLEPAGFSRAGERVNTFPATLPVRPLDGLWVRGEAQAERGFPSRHHLAREASDHLPLIAEINLNPMKRR